MSFWYRKTASRWSVNLTWLMSGLIPALCLMRRFIIRSRIKTFWITVKYIRLTLSRKVWIRHADGSLHCMLSLLWYLIVCRIKPWSLMDWYLTRTVIRCPSVLTMLSIRLLRLRSMVLIRCVGTWLLTHLHGIIWNSTLKESKKFAVSSSVPYIIHIRSLRCMPM